MIYTITLNPSIDYVMFTDGFEQGALNRAHTTYKFAGGKGINVSRVLKTLDNDTTVHGFLGGFPGQFIKDKLQSSNILVDCVEVNSDTRINVKLKGASETEINAPGPDINEQHIEQLMNKIEALTTDDTVIIAGSIPKSMPDDIYAQIAKRCYTKNIPFVVDAEKNLLNSVLQYKPLFVKPNIVELEEMFDTQLQTDEAIICAAKQLMHKGAQMVFVSMGGDGAMLVTHDKCFKAIVPRGQVVNTVGAGDSTVAGMIAGLTNNLSIEDAFKQAVACGTATAFTEDLASTTVINDVLQHIKIKQIY
ncbi:1-phosphofructokinase [Macrococcus armenti]|uniref:1-phosphofructokinase n=1 Tax=Macrococcus armenti TaxID=2875764 RepID=UPI001CCC4E83|nr:1-phosphofructokinase [Macrococcus armenti]UBH09120.1 1-phosphofructokinase [Macrococcus armenti]UBH11415.1 1-phosphofructokinase [Macrococcus armenti]UBH15897.1 1-phosphofructokinase [Macrococcus armenti]UBH18257.1 1-phosphofructokinase [Macrococcus armenti]UBH20523.1 1-phosphofructokinase [Macrococcus armenti]